MNAIRILVFTVFAALPLAGFALSRSIDRDIEFPKGYDAGKAEAIRGVIRDEQFKFVGGTVSYWPPDLSTCLSFEGDANSLNSFLQKLKLLKGIGLRVILYHGRDDEHRRDSDDSSISLMLDQMS